MGGSGSGIGLNSSTDLKRLEEKSKELLKKNLGEDSTPNVFISFSKKDESTINALRAQSKNEELEFKMRDHSVKVAYDSEDANYIKRKIREKINRCSTTVCYLTKDSAKSKWVDWEIRESKRLGKGIVAMYSGDSAPTNLPPAITEFKIKPVRWTSENLNSSISEASKERS